MPKRILYAVAGILIFMMWLAVLYGTKANWEYMSELVYAISAFTLVMIIDIVCVPLMWWKFSKATRKPAIVIGFLGGIAYCFCDAQFIPENSMSRIAFSLASDLAFSIGLGFGAALIFHSLHSRPNTA